MAGVERSRVSKVMTQKGEVMAVCIIVRLKVDPIRMKKLPSDRAEELRSVGAEAQGAGAVHHFFAAGDSEVLIVDEWDSAASFEKFFDNPTIAGFMAETGVEGPPEVSVYELLDSPDRF
jgi:quinol monooxygenase YgiN